jgi:hypothetical protein
MIPKTCTISPDFLWDRHKQAFSYFYIYTKNVTNLSFFRLIPQQYEIYQSSARVLLPYRRLVVWGIAVGVWQPINKVLN